MFNGCSLLTIVCHIVSLSLSLCVCVCVRGYNFFAVNKPPSDCWRDVSIDSEADQRDHALCLMWYLTHLHVARSKVPVRERLPVGHLSGDLRDLRYQQPPYNICRATAASPSLLTYGVIYVY